ncbi:MAG: translation initiation factor IF-3 [Endomicrobia bacterium]|nr:translation initiation factor IF-3 [Endomicrobiia bacterium]
MDTRKYRVNQYIRAKDVRVIDENGHQIGVIPLQQALQKAQQLGLDLVEIAPQANPPVCKIIDFSKFKYQQEKKEKEIRKSQKLNVVKEIYLKPTITEHDLQIKINHIKEFLIHSHPTKIVITYLGRLINYFNENSQQLIDKLQQELQSYGKFVNVKKDNNKVTILIEPLKDKKEKKDEKQTQITQRSEKKI